MDTANNVQSDPDFQRWLNLIELQPDNYMRRDENKVVVPPSKVQINA